MPVDEMDRETLLLLEFPEVLGLVANFAQSAVGKLRIAHLKPTAELSQIEQDLDQVEEGLDYLRSKGKIAFDVLEDPRLVVSKLRAGRESLEPKELLYLSSVLKLATHLRGMLGKGQWPRLKNLVDSIPALDGLVKAIESVIDPTGSVLDKAHPKLAGVRRQQSRAREKVQRHLGRYFTGSQAKFLIQDPYITVRNGRYVIPVKVENLRSVPGVVHATSSSGATLFVEPVAVVSLNNDCVQNQQREQEIVDRVLRDLALKLRDQAIEIDLLTQKLAELDALFARAGFAVRYQCGIPRLNGQGILKVKDARHPLLTERLGSEEVVPISVALDAQHSALVISGPNAGGKTVALKTVGLLSVMAQSGLPVPASAADFPVFKQVLADIGDHQSIAQQLSTFSAHILRIKTIIDEHEAPSLILLDELGTGTDPVYGAALGVAVIDFLRARSSIIVATTHHQAIKAFASTTSGVENASVLLDPKSMYPTYRLEFGVAGESSALEIAAQLGLQQAVTEQARAVLTDKDLQAERYLQRLRAETNRWTQKHRELSSEVEKTRTRKEELETEFQAKEQARDRHLRKVIEGWAAEFRAENLQFLKSIKDRMEAARVREEMKRREALSKERFQRRMSVQKAAAGKPAAILAEGDWVYHPFFQKQGRIVALEDGTAVVEIEGKRISSFIDQLEKIEAKKPSRKLPPNITVNVVEEEQTELGLIGLTVEEALPRVDKFLDRAFLSGLSKVRIVHGFGTGRLKAALSDFLKHHPHVATYQVEGGATAVVLQG